MILTVIVFTTYASGANITDSNLFVELQVDTNLQSPDDFVHEGVPGIGKTYNIAPYSSILLEAK